MFDQLEKKIREKIRRIPEEPASPSFFSFEGGLVFLSRLYGLGTGIRYKLYRSGLLRSKKLACPVISIGNVVAGGTGKTPMAVCLADILAQMGRQCLVVSRGYKGTYKGLFSVVSDGKNIYTTPKECGDEPYMMASLKKFPVVVGRDRYEAGKAAVSRFNPDVILLDDGFQHLKLKRQLDLVLFDFYHPVGNGRLLPAGFLRESLKTAAKRADTIIFTRCPGPGDAEKGDIKPPEGFEHLPRFRTIHQPYVAEYISKGKAGQTNDKCLASLKGKTAVLFSGIAKNQSFYDSVVRLGVNVLDHFKFEDHYAYTNADLHKINESASQKKADLMMTTLKDRARIDQKIGWTADLVVMDIRIEFENKDTIASLLKETLDRYAQ